jgi:parallel beta-helix repeat protein
LGARKLLKKIMSGIIVALLSISIFILVFDMQPIKASGTIYIRADGSVDPPEAQISTIDNVTYSFIGDLNDCIVVERDNIIVDGKGYFMEGAGSGTAIDLSYRSNVTIKGILIVNFAHGIVIYYSLNNRIVDNYIECISFAIRLECSSNNNITKNEFFESLYGVMLYNSSSNDISGNKIDSNGKYGIQLSNSSKNEMHGNTMTRCRNGIYFDNSSDNNLISANCIEYGNGIYFHLSSDNTISGNNITSWWGSYSYDGIKLVESPNNTISENNLITKEWECIKLFQSSNNNTISRNDIIAQQGVCIMLSSSSGNTIVQNNMREGHYGMCFYSSSSNMIYRNSFLDNTWSQALDNGDNTWDTGFPSGGNFWSDYNGSDLYNGPSQNQTGSDGIGDTPYAIDGCMRADNYPLMNPWMSPNISVTNIRTSKTIVGEGFDICINVSITNHGNKIECFDVEVYANMTSISSQNLILTNGASLSTTFTWNTTSWVKGNYTINAYVPTISGEVNIAGNQYIDGWVFVTIPGDVDGDKEVYIYDFVRITCIYWSQVGNSEYKANSDINGDGIIDIYDLTVCTSHYGQSW